MPEEKNADITRMIPYTCSDDKANPAEQKALAVFRLISTAIALTWAFVWSMGILFIVLYPHS